ncbi:MAG: D-hexose-6-phosphate mutarotase [Pirellulaceae bacterium]|nr:D-hexose-6-phosphate mutarotase [Pirellulaceae bacterium]
MNQLNEYFAIPGLRFEAGAGGLTRAVIESTVARGEVYLQGAHVTQYQPNGQAPVLWMSEKSNFELGKPIRGGVPICFPWFGANPKDANAPAHGLARTTLWNVVASSRLADGGIGLTLSAAIGGFSLRYQADIGKVLRLCLTVECLNSATEPLTFEAALHTYFTVSDIQQISILGLESFDYIDKVSNITKRAATGQPIRFTFETDRVYQDTKGTCELRDPGLKRTISIEPSNSRSTIVWNPWIEKSARMTDFGNDEWPAMVCIETANVGDQAITLETGQSHSVETRIVSL